MSTEEAVERATSALNYRITLCKQNAERAPESVAKLMLEGVENDEKAIKVLESLPF